MKPCDICLEKVCKAKGGVGTCNCEICAIKKECPRKLTATIRITLKCTQSCSHCCYSCSPNKDTHMTVESAKKIAKFLIKNEVYQINLMGGEIFCNPNWREILDLLVPAVTCARVVSNGDWVVEEPSFAKHFTKYNNCYVVISKDMWHTNKNIVKADKLLRKNNILTRTSDLDESEFNLVPIGRAEGSFGFYSMMGCYCQNPKNQYSFLIDEVGDIFKCGFGVWKYADVYEYIDGGFAERFKEFNKIFYGVFIPHCASCIRSHEFSHLDRKKQIV
jgi:hypothetical protein